MSEDKSIGEPGHIGAEQALLGALLSDNRLHQQVRGVLEPEAFLETVHGDIYRAISRQIEQREVADPITLRAEFEHSHAMRAVGGPAYLQYLTIIMSNAPDVIECARLIHGAWQERLAAQDDSEAGWQELHAAAAPA